MARRAAEDSEAALACAQLEIAEMEEMRQEMRLEIEEIEEIAQASPYSSLDPTNPDLPLTLTLT